MSVVPEDRLAEFYDLVRRLIELRIAVGYDLEMLVDGGRYRVRITETGARAHPQSGDGPLVATS